MHGRHLCAAIGATALLALVAPACGSDGTAAASDVCAAKDDLAASLHALADVQVLADGTNAAKAKVSAVDEALREVRNSAEAEYRDEVDAVQNDYDDLRAAVSKADKESSASAAVASVSSAVTALAHSANALAVAVGKACDG